MKIYLDLDVQPEFEYEAPYNNETPGGTEFIPGIVTITSVKCNGIEIMSLIPQEDIENMQLEILQEKINP